MEKELLLLSFLFLSFGLNAQVSCSAIYDTGGGYVTLNTCGFNVENPDCEHSEFGPHITQIFDAILQNNVFVFHSHIQEDNDRCQVFDRVRIEIKGGPNTNQELQHPESSTSYYRWKFKIDEQFVGASSFCHIFQNKGYGGEDVGAPILTLTLREHKLELRHRGGESGLTLGKLMETDLSPFIGKWVEGFVMQSHDEHGQLVVCLKDVLTGDLLLEYHNDDIDLWRTGASFNRPKWGVYRKKGDELKDEEVRFADFCISEVDSVLCPSTAGEPIISYIGSTPILNEFRLFPNPTSDELFLYLGGNEKGMVSIFSLNGTLIQEPILITHKKSINLSSFERGLYIVNIKLQNGVNFSKILTVQNK